MLRHNRMPENIEVVEIYACKKHREEIRALLDALIHHKDSEAYVTDVHYGIQGWKETLRIRFE